MGGNKLKLFGSGFDLIAENNLVVVGALPCRVLETYDDMLVCVTEPTTFVVATTTTVSVAVKGK